MEKQEFILETKEKALLLKIARESLEHYLLTGRYIDYDDNILPIILLTKTGAFVSLQKGNALRGCVGNFKSDKPLYQLIQEMVVAAALRDKRFPPVRYGELNQIKIEVSVLSPLERINCEEELELGKHGIYIKKGNNSGTFLPQVATTTGWSKEEFIGFCSKNKACIGYDGWREAELYVYTAQVFSEKELRI